MKRTIEIGTSGTRLFLKDHRLVVQRDEEDLASIPLEDVGVVVLDSCGISISSGLLKALADEGCALLTCDDSHHPHGLFLPLTANTLHGERIRFQAEIATTLKKSLWARIVRQKIENQAAVGPPTSTPGLMRLSREVKSGDSNQCEARAARLYWAHVFVDLPIIEQPFHRFRDGPPPNNLLNYGYAILRALIARCLCGAGLHPGLGLHHRNKYNSYALADDVMEPFRPVVDKSVKVITSNGCTQIHKESKRQLLDILSTQVFMNEQTMSVELAAERCAGSLAKALTASAKEGRSTRDATRVLQLPTLTASRTP